MNSRTQQSSSSSAAAPGAPRRTSIQSGGRKKVHSSFADGSELVEEFDARTDELLLRKRRHKNFSGAFLPWQYEVGAPNTATNTSADSSAFNTGEFVIREGANHVCEPVLFDRQFDPQLNRITNDMI